MPEDIQDIGGLFDFAKGILSFGFADALENAESIPAFLADYALNVVFAIIGLVLLAYIIYGGVLWITSAGDPQRLQKAQGAIVNALIGFAIVILSWSIVTVVMTMFGLRKEDGSGEPAERPCEGYGLYTCPNGECAADPSECP